MYLGHHCIDFKKCIKSYKLAILQDTLLESILLKNMLMERICFTFQLQRSVGIEDLNEFKLLPGWEWKNEWEVVLDRAVDNEGMPQ